MAAAAAAAAASAAASSDLLDSDAAAISSQFSLLVRTQPTCSSLHTANGNGAGNGSAGTGNQPEVTVCLRDEALASILSAKAVMTQRAFEIKVDDVVFLGYSESLAAGAVGVSNKGDSSCPASIPDAGSTASSTGSAGSGSPQQRRKSAAGSSSISTFCIIFAVRCCCAPKSINKLYIQLGRQLTTALRHEEQRCKFFTHSRSSSMMQLRTPGSRDGCYVLPSLVESCLMSLQPYHCVLPLTDYSSSSSNPLEAGANGGLTYSHLPMDCNPLMSRFLRALSPQKSLLDIRLETDMAYSVALEFARHLVRWGSAIICHPVTDANVYVLNPRLDVLLEESPDLVADYQNQCSSHSQSMPSLAELPARLRDRLSPPVQLTIQRLPQSSEPADLELLADAVDLLELDSSRSCHIEHLAHHLGRHRTQIVALVDKFQPI
uniref:GATOR complex protein NPRL3 n=1 Tax=Macrostomum lignano TaxID=282301 RepID=A0A1I8F442_9PLAT